MIICDLCHKSNIKQIGIQGNPIYDSNGFGFHFIGHGVEFKLSAHRRHLGFILCPLGLPRKREGCRDLTNKASDQIGIFYEILLSIAAEYD